MFKILKVLAIIVFVYLIFSSVASAASSVKSYGGKITEIEKLNEGEYTCDHEGSIITVRTRLGIEKYYISTLVRPATKNELKKNKFVLGNRKTEPTIIICKNKKDDKDRKQYIAPAVTYFGLSN